MRRILLLLLPLAGCAATPDMRGDHPAAQYQTDLAACEARADTSADAEVKRRFYSFVLYGITFPRQKRHDTEACMQSRGYSSPR